MHCTNVNSPVGQLQIFADDFALRRISFSAETDKLPAAVLVSDGHPLLCQAKAQLAEYFAGQRRVFDLPLSPQGTAFQKAVWTQIVLIPYGEIRSYGEIAARLGDANKARAVGGAAGKNPLPIVIPCHRVIGSSGRLTGFSGGLQIKEMLLALEKSV
ncbi:MAG: methylated-DNA--[protein]-cysteine S-methyltransferase [Candidatus Electronema sp. V4]|uniref:methylated-DNA--[protein]-cysteine S-methyltransferase n=1 Tax=Candidatus Electronema sp. V4 TaxID=3454756 RepID=UPI0040558A22